MEEIKNNNQNQNEEFDNETLDSVSGGNGIVINNFESPKGPGGPYRRRSRDDWDIPYGRRPGGFGPRRPGSFPHGGGFPRGGGYHGY